jgi:hypothetical protein
MALLAIPLLAGGLVASRAARPEPAIAVVHAPEWRDSTWFRLDQNSADAVCELPGGASYRLVIGCLSDATHANTVRVSLTDPTPPSVSARRVSSVWKFPAPAVRRQAESRLWFEPPPTPESSRESRRQTREFHLHVTDGDLDDPKQYARIVARSVACGRRVRVFLDQQLPDGEVSTARLDELLQLLEADVLPRVEQQFGPLRDLDGDGRFAVVLTPWLSRLQGGRTSLGGMVRSSDFQIDVPPPFGNRGDMLFLNSHLPSEAALRDLLSHEVAHAACLCQRLPSLGRQMPEEEDWISEALAHLAEPGWSNLDHRVATFLQEPSRYALVVADYYRAGLWRNPGCRGATYLFARWCAAQTGHNFVRQMVTSPIRGQRSLESVTGRRFEDLFREWSLSVASQDGFAELLPLLKRCGCDGLRPVILRDDTAGDRSFLVRGTAFQVLEVDLTTAHSRTLRVTGEPSARWQFSIRQVCDQPSSVAEPARASDQRIAKCP